MNWSCEDIFISDYQNFKDFMRDDKCRIYSLIIYKIGREKSYFDEHYSINYQT